jgi:hypothetical protein
MPPRRGGVIAKGGDMTVLCAMRNIPLRKKKDNYKRRPMMIGLYKQKQGRPTKKKKKEGV